MFTGLVEEIGVVQSCEPTDGGTRITIAATRVVDGCAVGDSVSVDGACLTVVDHDSGGFSVEAVPETLRRTVLGLRRPGDRVNLERAVRVGDRLGGHLVQGHIDGVGVVTDVGPDGDGVRIGISAPDELRRYLVDKGSITVDGVSLTVAAKTDEGCEVVMIPHTREVTTLGGLAQGVHVNLEVDVVAKYVAELHAPYRPGDE